MPRRVNLSRIPNSFSRSRSSITSCPKSRASPPFSVDGLGGALGAKIGRTENDIRPFPGRHQREPSAQGNGLPLAKQAQWHIDVAGFDIYHRTAGSVRRIARDIAGAFSVTHDPELCRPTLHVSDLPAGDASGPPIDLNGTFKSRFRVLKPGLITAG